MLHVLTTRNLLYRLGRKGYTRDRGQYRKSLPPVVRVEKESARIETMTTASAFKEIASL